MPSKDAIAGFRERGEQICRPQAACRKARAYLLARMFKAALLGKRIRLSPRRNTAKTVGMIQIARDCMA